MVKESTPRAVAIDASSTPVHQILVNGTWETAKQVDTFSATNPRTRKPLSDTYPVSGWEDIEKALSASTTAARQLRQLPEIDRTIAAFLDRYADLIHDSSATLAEAAAEETGLPVEPRLKSVELPRTVGQLRQTAAAVRDGSWCRATIDTKAGLRSCLAPLGPVLVFGPNNFPFAYNSIAGGDFASAIASGNPVIAKGHPLHPTTTRLLAELALLAAKSSGLPDGAIQLLYHVSPEDGLRAVRDPRIKAVAFTGSRAAGLRLKAAADAAGKLFFGEMSSLNPVVILPGAIAERGSVISDQLVTSITMGAGQFCTKPGLILLMKGSQSEEFIEAVFTKMTAAPVGTLFSEAGKGSLTSAMNVIKSHGARLVKETSQSETEELCIPNTLLRTTALNFLNNSQALQTEMFGNSAMLIVAEEQIELLDVLAKLEGNLTGSIYSASDGADDPLYNDTASVIRPKVGRLLNDKMPTGVAVSPAMCHGGPYPATSQPHFTAVGVPASILRFTQLESYDNVRHDRLPPCLADKNPNGKMWRLINGEWTRSNA